MTKPKSNAARLPARKASKPKSREQSVLAACKSPTRPKTKHGRIIAMLRTPAGATIAAIMTATDWQQHSVRGFLAGVVRKKLGLNLVSEQTDKGRLYRIKDGKASPLGSKTYLREAHLSGRIPRPEFADRSWRAIGLATLIPPSSLIL